MRLRSPPIGPRVSIYLIFITGGQQKLRNAPKKPKIGWWPFFFFVVCCQFFLVMLICIFFFRVFIFGEVGKS